jgi:hypothetical protein
MEDTAQVLQVGNLVGPLTLPVLHHMRVEVQLEEVLEDCWDLNTQITGLIPL